MTIVVLTVFKLVLLLLLYLFLARALRVVTADLYGPRRSAPAPQRQAVATSAPSSRRPRKAPRELVVHLSDRKPTVIPLKDGRVVLGRADDVDVLVDDPYVSDLHAEIVETDEGWAVRDLGSTNSTFLNGAKVTQPTLIGAGDQIRLGKTRIEVRR